MCLSRPVGVRTDEVGAFACVHPLTLHDPGYPELLEEAGITW